MLRIKGQLAFTKPQFIFHEEPVLDQTMTNLQQNTIGLNFVFFDDALFNYARREIITSDFTTSYLMT